jgi:hypothetical protein
MKTSVLLGLALLTLVAGCAVRATIPGASFAAGPYYRRAYDHGRYGHDRERWRDRYRGYDDRY